MWSNHGHIPVITYNDIMPVGQTGYQACQQCFGHFLTKIHGVGTDAPEVKSVLIQKNSKISQYYIYKQTNNIATNLHSNV